MAAFTSKIFPFGFGSFQSPDPTTQSSQFMPNRTMSQLLPSVSPSFGRTPSVKEGFGKELPTASAAMSEKDRNKMILLYALSGALRGKSPIESGLALKQNLQQQELQQRRNKIFQELAEDPRYADRIRLIEAGIDPRMLVGAERKIVEGADGYKYYVNPDESYERVFPKVKKPQKSAVVDPLRTITKGGKVVQNIRDSELTKEKLDEIQLAGQVVQPLGYTEKLESSVEEVFSDENQPFADKWQATNVLHENLQNYSNELAKMDEAALSGVGSTSKFVTSIVQNTQGFLNLASEETKSFYNDALAKNSYATTEGSDYTERLKTVANQYGVNESQVRDLAYLFAAARGQEGRGLSDKDYENALQIVSGGVGKEGKIAVIQNVYDRLGGEASLLVNNRIRTLEYLKERQPESKSFYEGQILQLKALLEATPFNPYINPLRVLDTQQQQTPTRIISDQELEERLKKYR